MTLADALPDFPWDSLMPARELAAKHPDGVVDLSIGTPVDDTPDVVADALTAQANAHGYPPVAGTTSLQSSIVEYAMRRWRSVPLENHNVLPVIGTKELVATLPLHLGIGRGHSVVYPQVAYPTYEVGALVAGARPVALDDPEQLPADVGLIWLNSPANPSGAILAEAELRRWVRAARERGAVLASDECYGEFAWDAEATSVLNPRVNDGELTGLLAVHSISKRSNAAGYRGGFVAGDASLVAQLLTIRKHLGLMVPAPVQSAMVAALADQEHVEQQRQIYLRRRTALRSALEAAGFTVADSQGSLYLWTTRGESCWETVMWLAGMGIVVAPGEFYGPTAGQFVRVALTASDERIASAVERLTASASAR